MSSDQAPATDGVLTDLRARLAPQQGDPDRARRQNLSDWIEPLPRLQVLPLPGDQFALVLSGHRDAADLDLEALAEASRECGAKSLLVFDQHIDVG
ncbi:hypothetical protein [Microbispora sp. CA-102843]|uniref:hypothetical protein n=1 Tax=Microbispora sp. CA-102843 TaxID=3239952 RepID=UPI003D8B041B